MQSLSFFLVIAAALATAAFSYFGTGLHPIWWMLWLAPVPVLAIAPRLSTSAAFLLGSGAVESSRRRRPIRRFVSLTGNVNVAREETFMHKPAIGLRGFVS